jgi:sugar transferase (PEP-CTERM system associated)
MQRNADIGFFTKPSVFPRIPFMPYILKKYYPTRNLVFVFGEGLLIFLTINAVFLSWLGWLSYNEGLFLFFLRALVVTVVFQLCFYFFDLYDQSVIPRVADHMLRVLQTFGFGCILLAFVYFLFPHLNISDAVFWSGLVAVGLAIFFWRLLYFWALEHRLFTQPIALIGTGTSAAQIANAIESKSDSGFKIVAYVQESPAGNELNGKEVPVFPQISDLRELCERCEIEKIILALDEKRGRLPMHELIQYKFMGIEILDAVGFYEELTGRIMVESLNPSWLLFSEGFYVGRVRRLLKRTVDLGAALAVFLVTLPVFVASALIIRFESPGGAFYLQERTGEHGRPFNVIKFRSMRADAEKDGPVWAAADDNRITRFGRFIRKSRIDELPQLINVLKGDMSFVGPRPERPVFVENLAQRIPFYNIRHMVKPGITGWAQIYYPYGASEEDALRKLEYDLYYIKNLSIAMDLSTIFQTIKVVLFQKGAR